MWENLAYNRKLKEAETALVPEGRQKAYRFLLAFPNEYSLGMSNLGFQTMLRLIREETPFWAERLFLPPANILKKMKETGGRLHSFDEERVAGDFDMMGFSISFELDYFNVLTMLELSGLPVVARERDENAPIVIFGGPAMTFNPLPMSDFADIVAIGEGEENMPALLKLYTEYEGDKNGFLKEAAKLPGFFVPRYPKKAVKKGYLADLSKYPAMSAYLTENTEFSRRFLIEISRGCSRNCRFCMAGYCYKTPRVLPLQQVKDLISEYGPVAGKVGLVGAAISDYPYIDELAEFLMEKNLPFSVASLRVDSLTEPLLRGLKASGARSLTLAPEAGSEAMRLRIHKGITEDHVLHAAEMARDFGIRNLKFYFIVGLPGETEADVKGIVDLVKKTENLVKPNKITVSVNPFIPKPFTPFEREIMEEEKSLDSKISFLKKSLHSRAIEFQAESPKLSKLQAILARGLRGDNELLFDIWKEGGNTAAMKRVLKQRGITADELTGDRYVTQPLPWRCIDMGVTEEMLHHHKELSDAAAAAVLK